MHAKQQCSLSGHGLGHSLVSGMKRWSASILRAADIMTGLLAATQVPRSTAEGSRQHSQHHAGQEGSRRPCPSRPAGHRCHLRPKRQQQGGRQGPAAAAGISGGQQALQQPVWVFELHHHQLWCAAAAHQHPAATDRHPLTADAPGQPAGQHTAQSLILPIGLVAATGVGPWASAHSVAGAVSIAAASLAYATPLLRGLC